MVVKRFKQPSPNQQLILDSFESQGWPLLIDNPLPSLLARQDAKRRLHSTIGNLDRAQQHQLIHFYGAGKGQSVGWLISDANAKEAGEGEIVDNSSDKNRIRHARSSPSSKKQVAVDDVDPGGEDPSPTN
jgi:hypothetical protein